MQLVDVSRADAPADVLGEQLIDAAGRLLFINDQRHEVITRGAPTTLNLLLKPVGHSPP